MKNMAGRMTCPLNEVGTRPENAEPAEVKHLGDLRRPCVRSGRLSLTGKILTLTRKTLSHLGEPLYWTHPVDAGNF